MKIVLVDDDQLVCDSLRTILEADAQITVTAAGTSGQEAVRLYEAHRPDVLLMDIQMQKMSGLEAGEAILRKHREAKILFLTTFSDEEYIVQALRIGAKGYLIKQKIEMIAPALKAVMAGQSVFGSEIVDKLPALLHRRPTADGDAYGLLSREMELVELVAQGMNNREIAASLCLSEGTVRNYLSVVLEKLGLRDRTQLVVFYYQRIKGI